MSIIEKWFGEASPALVGLDISSSAVKLLELVQKGSRVEVVAFATEPLPPSAVVDQQLLEPEVVAEAIRKVVAKSGTRQRAAAVAVAGPTVITKIVQLSAFLKEDDMEQQIRAEADQYIPFPIDEVSLDFQVLGPSLGRPEEDVDVLLAACRRDQVEARTLALELAGLQPRVVDIQNHALTAAARLLQQQMPEGGADRTIALVDLGASATNMLFLHDHELVYAREVAFGGRQLVEEIMRALEMSAEEATRSLRAGTLPTRYDAEIRAPFVDDIAQQIDRGLQFFFSAMPDYPRVDQIILTGGCALIEGLAPHIADRVGVPTELARPFARLSVASRANPKALAREEASLLLVAGLALRAIQTEVL